MLPVGTNLANVSWKKREEGKRQTHSELSLTCRKYSSARYMIFWGAPAHLTGVLGKVKMALPLLKFWMAWNVLPTVS